ncbi:MAG: hypothetical protein K0Q58_336 [Microbacterium sp.]|nr:hypothetical protein [Microbacterium sp.]
MSALRGLTAALAAGALLLTLSACAAGAPSSSLTVTYEVGDEQRTVTFAPDQITCDADRVHGLAVSVDPQGRMNLSLDGDRRGSMGAATDDGLVLFEGTGLSLSADGDDLVVAESPGEVALIEGWTPEDGVDVDAGDAERVPATLSGSIRCDTPVSVPSAAPESAPASSDPTAVSVAFTADGTARTVSFVPSSVSCDARVTATTVEPGTGMITFDATGSTSIDVTVTDEAGTTAFRADDVALTPESDGSYWIQRVGGEVSFWAGASGGTLRPEDAVTGSGTLSALVVCP